MHEHGGHGRPIAAVLAGGESRRMGRDKAFLRVAGRELLERTLDAALDATGEALLVVRDVPVYRRALERYGLPISSSPDGEGVSVRLLRDTWGGAGPLAGLETAAGAAPGRPLWLLPCDMPFVSGALGRTLLGKLSDGTGVSLAADEHPAHPKAVVPVSGGRTHPLCAAYEPSVAAVARRLLERGERRMARLLERLDVIWAAPRLLRAAADGRDPLQNVNDPAALRRARKAGSVEKTRGVRG